jgi:predicted helicase
MGIDLIAKTKTGTYWAVQCKYRSNTAGSLSWRDISTFVGLSFIRDRFEYCLIAYTGDKYSSILKQADEGRIGFLSSDKWEELDESFFNQLHARLRGTGKELEPRHPKPHQQRAIENAKLHFIQNGNARGKLIMPCGAGKSLTAFWITEALNAKTVIVAVPSLALIQQTLPDWLREYSARGGGGSVCAQTRPLHMMWMRSQYIRTISDSHARPISRRYENGYKIRKKLQ